MNKDAWDQVHNTPINDVTKIKFTVDAEVTNVHWNCNLLKIKYSDRELYMYYCCRKKIYLKHAQF